MKQPNFLSSRENNFISLVSVENKLISMIGKEAFEEWKKSLPVGTVISRYNFIEAITTKIKDVNHCACFNCKTRRETVMIINAMKARIEYGLVTLPELIELEERYIERYEKRLPNLICSIHGKQS